VKNNHFFREEEVDATGVQLGARYDGSPIIANENAPPLENFDEYTPSGAPGGRAPHLWLDDRHDYGSSLFDQLCRGFTLLRINDTSIDVEPVVRAAKSRNIPFAVLDIPFPEALELYGHKLALIRPDQYICWRGDRLPADPVDLLKRVTGHVRPADPITEHSGKEKQYWSEQTAVD
jgi:hypothetical protein